MLGLVTSDRKRISLPITHSYLVEGKGDVEGSGNGGAARHRHGDGPSAGGKVAIDVEHLDHGLNNQRRPAKRAKRRNGVEAETGRRVAPGCGNQLAADLALTAHVDSNHVDRV